jgi:hypothetical protein
MMVMSLLSDCPAGKAPASTVSFLRIAMKVAQHFSAGLAFLNARFPPGTIEYGLAPQPNRI